MPGPPRWCVQCAGQLLAGLVAHGQVVTVTGLAMHTGPDSVIELDSEVGVADLQWTVDLTIEMLRYSQPSGLRFVRALGDEGSTATTDRLREITGDQAGMTLAVDPTAAYSRSAAIQTVRHSDSLGSAQPTSRLPGVA